MADPLPIVRRDRIMGASASRAVGRFNPEGPDGYHAASAPNAPLRGTRGEAVEDERCWLDSGAAVSHPTVRVERTAEGGATS